MLWLGGKQRVILHWPIHVLSSLNGTSSENISSSMWEKCTLFYDYLNFRIIGIFGPFPHHHCNANCLTLKEYWYNPFISYNYRYRMRWLYSITDLKTWICTNTRRQWRTEEPGMLQSTGLQSQTCLSNWTTNYLVVTTLFPSPGQGRQLYIFCVRRNHFSLINWLSIHLPSNCFILGFEHTSHFLPLDKRSEETHRLVESRRVLWKGRF